MIKAFLISFRLRNTYKANGFIYFLRQLPLVKKLIPAKAYKSRGLKRLANVVAWIREFVTAFLWKGIYLLIVFGIVLSMHEGAEASAFLNAFFFLTLAGGFLNTQLFDPTNDKYYAIILMGMNAKDYTVSNYIYFLIKVIVGFLPLTCLFAFLLDLGPLWGVGMMLYVLFVKLVFAAFILWDDVKDSKLGTVSSEEEKRMAVLVWIAAALLCVLGFGLPYTGLVFPVWVYGLILGLLFLMSVPSAIYIFLCRDYQRVCRELLKKAPAFSSQATSQNQLVQTQTLKRIEYTKDDVQTKKQGYAYFNALFFARHRKILVKPARRICVVSVILFAAMAVACRLNRDFYEASNEMLLNMLPFFLFVMYLIHPGRSMTQAMFMNCDHSMLSYRFYRQPRVILSLFVERLKSLTLISLIPAGCIAAEMAALLAITGGTQTPVNYVLIIVTILMMSVFFSVHYMVLYYLLQPYNIQLENRNAAYGIVNGLTYLVCYMAMSRRVPTMIFGTAMTGFCILYIVIALILVYRMAPKTFKLR